MIGAVDIEAEDSSPVGAEDASQQRSVVDRIADRLRTLAPLAVWRDIIAALACVVTVASLTGGLLQWVSWLQLGIIAGIVVGLVSSAPLRAAAVAALSTVVGLIEGPPDAFRPNLTAGARLIQGELTVVVAAVVAAAVVLLLRSNRRAAWATCLFAVVLIVVNLWATPLDIDAEQTFNPATQSNVPSFNERIDAAEIPAEPDNDHIFFLRVARALATGQPYYKTFREEFVTWSGGKEPSAVTNVRFPLSLYVWSLFRGHDVVVGFLAVATLAIAAAVIAASTYVKPPLVIPAVAALASYFVYFTVGFVVISAEAWGACFALLAMAALALSYRHSAWRWWFIASIAFGVIAALFRETLVFVPLASLAAAAFHDRDQRAFRVGVSAAGVVVTAIALGVHYFLARSVIDPASAYDQFMLGSLGNVRAALVYATDELGYGGFLAMELGILGLLGALLVGDRRLKAFTVVAAVVPLASFLFLGNTAVDVYTREPINYWGAGVVPLLYACIPFVFLLLPGAARAAVRTRR